MKKIVNALVNHIKSLSVKNIAEMVIAGLILHYIIG